MILFEKFSGSFAVFNILKTKFSVCYNIFENCSSIKNKGAILITA